MKEQLQQRVQLLKTEYEAGQQMLADLEAKQMSLRETMLRISGAIQVLEEMLTTPDASTDAEEDPLDSHPQVESQGNGASHGGDLSSLQQAVAPK
jgi:predicted nuclease with TOPRIM domain